jgi:alkanesulfonate monooxygenase SsuD/methylene tetrahydromethanopterin reductase-like flavin-dependent oxidoreductase (luciferase family)
VREQRPVPAAPAGEGRIGFGWSRLMLRYYANFPPGIGETPEAWARAREAEGWHGLCASDHLWVGDTPFPHVWVLATRLALATHRTRIATSFANNLFRSPVEFAQASLALQAASGGRFEAGLGAGWARDELAMTGRAYPEPPERISMYVEALQVARDLLRTGRCRFSGTHYRVAIEDRQLADVGDQSPPLVASAGGPRAIRETAPIVDRLELKPNARATRVGHLDFGILATVTEAEVSEQVARARRVRDDLPLGMFVLCAAGDETSVAPLREAAGDGFLARFVGAPRDVAAALADLEGFGLGHVQLTELVPGTHARLAAHLQLGSSDR